MISEQKPKVLIIDDEVDMRDSLAMWLDLVGYAVTAAASGEEALRLAREQPFDVALTDLRMPGLDGYATTEGLLAIQPRLRVVVCTGYASEADCKKLHQSGALGCFNKPVDPDTLLKIIFPAGAENHPPANSLKR